MSKAWENLEANMAKFEADAKRVFRELAASMAKAAIDELVWAKDFDPDCSNHYEVDEVASLKAIEERLFSMLIGSV